MANKNNPILSPAAEQNVIALLGLSNLPDGQRAMLLDKMTNIIGQRLILRVLDSLAEDKREDFKKLIDSGEETDVQDFLLVNAPLFLDWLAEETVKLKEEMIKAIK